MSEPNFSKVVFGPP